MACTHGNANTELAKEYISKRKIPQLFEVTPSSKPIDQFDLIRFLSL